MGNFGFLVCMKSRRAVSPLLAVIILIGITIVGGVLVNDSVVNLIIPQLSQMEYKITDLRMEKNSKGACYFSVEIFNSGTEVIKKAHLKTTLDSGEDWVMPFDGLGEGLNPGESAEIFEQIPFTNDVICGNFTVAKTYSFSINASSAVSSANFLHPMKVSNVTQT